MGLLDRYVLRVFALTWVVIGAALLGLFSVFDLLGHGDELGQAAEQGGALAALVGRYYLYSLPFHLVQFAPYVTLMAGIGTVQALARGREWTPMLAAGRPSLRAFLPLFLGAAMVALGVSAARERLLPGLAAPREALDKHVFAQRDWQMDDLWARGRDAARLHAERFDPGTVPGIPGGAVRPPALLALEVYDSAADGAYRLLTADAAVWDGQGWELRNGLLVTEGRSEERRERFEHPDLEPADLQLAYFAQVNPLFLSAAQLRDLLSRDPQHRQAATLLWSWRLAPLGHVLLLLIGLPFVLRFDRRSTLEGVAIGMLLGGLYFVLEILLQDLGGRGVLPAFWAGAGATLLFGSLAFWALDRLPT
ncbi:MAG: LptF/LptG family permease [Planctomycetota bacterium]|nr:MAG: LptF/LptG family permease [Planctomycetota bacterium]